MMTGDQDQKQNWDYRKGRIEADDIGKTRRKLIIIQYKMQFSVTEEK